MSGGHIAKVFNLWKIDRPVVVGVGRLFLAAAVAFCGSLRVEGRCANVYFGTPAYSEAVISQRVTLWHFQEAVHLER